MGSNVAFEVGSQSERLVGAVGCRALVATRMLAVCVGTFAVSIFWTKRIGVRGTLDRIVDGRLIRMVHIGCRALYWYFPTSCE